MQTQNPRLKELFETPKRKTYSLLGITAVLLGVSVVVVIRPTFTKIADLNREIKDKQAFLVKIEDKLATVNNLVQQKNELSEELTSFEDTFAPDERSGFIVANLAEIADEYQVVLLSVGFDDEEVDYEEFDVAEEVKILKIEVLIEGRYKSIENYVKHLEAFPRIIDIRGLTYQSNDIVKFQESLSTFQPVKCAISGYMFYWEDEYFEEVEEV